jgi:hypothetical protein
MALKRWTPPQKPTRHEEWLLKRLRRTRKLFAFLRLHRSELFEDEFQAELETMYRNTGAGQEPNPPALMCMALLLQCYVGASDAEAVELTVVDARWQLVLDHLGATEPAFSQGALQQFRERLIRHNMDRRLLERTVELARATKEFDWKKLPKDLRVGVDSRPLEGAGRVEDTFNLLGHAARNLVASAAELMDHSFEDICRKAGIPLLLAPSIKAGLDVDWNDAEQKAEALVVLVEQLTSLVQWVDRKLPESSDEEPLRTHLETVEQIKQQDLETGEGGRVRLRQGVAPDRRVSIEDPEMRHGRKSKSKRFNGYKEHVATDLDGGLILACAVTPANVPEEQATPALQEDLDRQDVSIGELNIDRAYVNSSIVEEVQAQGGEVVCKPWSGRNSRANLFGKKDFKLDMRARTITCPAGEVEPFEPGQVVHFDPEACGYCSLRGQCTMSASGRGRTITTARDEQFQQRLRKLQKTHKGRQRLRRRTPVEHRLAHIAARKGRRARYLGTRKNLYDLRRAAAIQNLEAIHRKTPELAPCKCAA